jgi:hypothetical protein
MRSPTPLFQLKNLLKICELYKILVFLIFSKDSFMISRNQLIKAALFTASLAIMEHYLENGPQHIHHHHHHHHNLNQEVQEAVSDFAVKVVYLAATGLIAAARFGVSSVSNNNNIVMTAGEFALGYLTPGGNLVSGFFRGALGGSLAAGINAVVLAPQAEVVSGVRKRQ